MARGAVHICSFSVGLDEMTRKDQRQPAKVLRVLHQAGRFSVFEATANQTIANTMTYLNKHGYIEIDNSPGYPWSKVKLTAAGFALAGLPSAPADTTGAPK